ncbi:MAG: hypothetical protein WBD58_22910 [Geitlerinemataceae cyanobacterium]
MLEIQIAEKACELTYKALNHITEGGLEALGAEILQFLKKRLSIPVSLNQAQDSPEQLQAAILAQFRDDQSFKNDLEKIVLKYQKIEQTNSNVFQNTESGVNINAPNSKVVGQQFFRNQ